MLDLRIYRAALIPALAAVIVVMFSLDPRPEPLRAEIPPDAFDSRAASKTARDIVATAPEREPGSEGDERIADEVARRFGAIEGGEVSQQRFETRYRGERISARNIILALPGQSSRTVAVIAHRDSAVGPGAVTSAAATGALVEIAEKLGRSRHRKKLLIVSTGAGAAGAEGAKRFAERFSDERFDAAVVLDQPAVRDGRTPFLLPWSGGPQSPAVQLVQSAKTAIRQEVGRDPAVEGPLGHLLRLALPFGLQEQTVLNEAGLDAVTLSSNGEIPASAEQGDGRANGISLARMAQFGRATLALVSAVDGAREGPKQGAEAYVLLAGNVLPGWALALLGLAALLPATLTAVDGFARARRSRSAVMPWLRWVLGGALPFVLVLVAAHLLARLAWIPDPGFPYDPGRYPLDLAAAAALAALAMMLGIAWLVVRPLIAPGGRPGSDDGASAAVALVLCASAVSLWAVNPYLALFVVPAVHLWLFAVLPDAPAGRWTLAAMIVGGLIPPILAYSYLADRLDVGFGILWQLVLMVTGGHIDVLSSLIACMFAACLIAVVAVARSRLFEREGPRPITVRGPIGYAGPGSLGGTDSAMGRR